MKITFDGRQVEARDGDTVASALYRDGVRIFTRSFKYHRPRGLLCNAGRCPNCLVNVDGVPNVRACMTAARDGMSVRPQNALPSLEGDALAAIDRFGQFFPPGFYYKTFINKHYWHLVEPMIRRIAGLGVVDFSATGDPHETGYEHVYLHPEVTVVGGGPAGMSAALAAARAGAKVLLVDEQPVLGGSLRFDRAVHFDAGEHAGLTGSAIAEKLRREVEATPGIEVRTAATAFGCYEGLYLGVIQGKSLLHVRTGRLVVATGAFEYPPVFQNNDLPGIMLGTAAQRLIREHAIKPGSRAVVATNNAVGCQVAADLLESGVEVVGFADGGYHPGPSHSHLTALKERFAAARVPLLAGHQVVEALGSKHLSGVRTAGTDGVERQLACDLLCVSTGFTGANGLLYQSGAKLEHDAALRMFVPISLPPNVYAAGSLSGVQSFAECLTHGENVGRAATAGVPLLHPSKTPAKTITSPGKLDPLHESSRQFLCFCMDVTEKDVKQCVAEGFDEMELLKRYATVGMGPCQGKMCGMNNIAACARATGKSVAETGTTTQRQPIQPVALGALAGPAFHPIRRTPLHQKHVDLGARFIDMGEWKRPLHYGVTDSMTDGSDVDIVLPDEYRAVRERVGIIDVSTLGKLEVSGPDAARLLDRVYTSEISRLRPGRTRYGIMCDDSGVLLDDGTVTLLAPNKYLLTTTTGNLDFVEQWLTRQALGTGWNVHVTNVTAGYASINVAGPKARATLSKLTNLDLSPAAFAYMGFARAEVAGVPAMLSRLGFVGEVGWEVHVPAECGEWLWEELLRAGKEFDITPFGVDTQRLLRLEKRHVIIGVDTDALASPLEVGLEELVRWNKPDFIGKKALKLRRQREGRDRLVGFVVEGELTPLDGAAFVVGRRVGGRVTSCRRSPHVGKAIGLGWIIAEQSRPGTRLEIIHEDRPVVATVTEGAFYDPSNERQKG